MKVKTIESNAEWQLHFRVVDRKARIMGRKYLVYENKSQLSTESLVPEILKSLTQAQHCIKEKL